MASHDLSRAFSEPQFLSTFGRSFPQQVARTATLSKLPNETGPALLSPEFDASFKHHSYSALLGPKREHFRNTQKYWAREPPRPAPPVPRKPPYILGEKLRRQPPAKIDPHWRGCPVGCYSGIVEWGSGGRNWHDTPSPTGASSMATIGSSPTGRYTGKSQRSSHLALPRVVPGF
mmetsp:Transcript_18105/g.31741  ORF Transcript_18105/g.31741 Transcript_18105/m.31741 type:complete len:175 (-) Transcript_18105:116-640(-)